MRRPVYSPSTGQCQAEKVDSLIDQCYPVVQERVTQMAQDLFDNARKRGHKFVTLAGAREIVLMLVLHTGGKILE